MAQLRYPQPRPTPELRYVRAPQPIVFPEEEEVPEGYAHAIVRMFLFQLLEFLLAPEHSVCTDQFIYWNASNPKRTLAPDVFVRLGVSQTLFGSWKTWEQGGVPELAVEIVSPNEGDGIAWDEKIARYYELGVHELVRFDPAELEGSRLRVWDRVQNDLVERVIANDRTPCLTLGLAWAVRTIRVRAGEVVGLRLVDNDGCVLESRDEQDARLRAEEARLRAEAVNRAQTAESRVRELEEELRKRGA